LLSKHSLEQNKNIVKASRKLSLPLGSNQSPRLTRSALYSGEESSMVENNRVFSIDDTLGTSDNLATFMQVLEAMDAPLGTALSQYLISLTAGQPVDTAAIWDVLHAAMAPADSNSAPSGGEAEGAA
jgi:hypothetical protein